MYQMVTDQIVVCLEAGHIPWKQGWQDIGKPRNLASQKEYRGINVWMLWGIGAAKKYESAYWITYRQAEALGGHVRRGEKASPVVFWKFIEVQDPDSEAGTKKIPLLRYYSVFNLSQIEGIEAPDKPTNGHNPSETAEALIAGYPNPPVITKGGDRAYYNLKSDEVTVPVMERFETVEDYYSTVFHELVHSTRGAKRTGRDTEVNRFGDEKYSQEELVAEMGAAFLLAECGMEAPVLKNNAAYIQNWLKVFKGDKQMLVKAGGQAQRAVDYILGRTQKQEENS